MDPEKQLPEQLKVFVETLKGHPVQNGVSMPKAELGDFKFLQEYSSHWYDCSHGQCMGYHTGLMNVYLRSLSEEQVRVFFSELLNTPLIGDSILDFICYRVFRENPSMKLVEIGEYRDLDCYSSSTGYRRGKVLAKNIKGTLIFIKEYTLDGEQFLVPNIWPKGTGKYLTHRVIYNILTEEVIKSKGDRGYEYLKRLDVH